MTTSGSASICYDADFTPYGSEIAHTSTCAPNYKFTGFERDSETQIDYAMNRYYNPRLGRFMSVDPLASTNRYTYAANNPLSLVDPLGLSSCGTSTGSNDCVSDPSQGGPNGDDEPDLASMVGGMGICAAGTSCFQQAIDRYNSIRTTGWDPVLQVQYYEYEFRGQGTCNGGSDCSVFEQQKELAAIKLGEEACSGDARSCIMDAYHTLYLKTPDHKDGPLVGGNFNFDWKLVVIKGEHIDGFGCLAGRCGLFDSLHFHKDGTFHVDGGNPLFVPLGTLVHFGWDYIGGHTVWKDEGIPRLGWN